MTPKITYQDFEIEIRSTTQGRYEARVLTSPLGRAADGKFILPYPVDELDGVLAALEGGVLVSSRAPRDWEREDPGSEPREPVVVEDLGRRLFRSLFPKEIERCLREAMGIVRGQGGDRQDHGLRVRVTFDRKEDLAVLATLPWEFLWEEGQFVNRCRLTPVVRSVNERLPPVPGEIESPLRVLLIPSDPKDLDPLETEHEARLVTEALKRNPGIEAVTLEHLRIDQLRSRVVDGSYHVVQFMGHGGFHENEFVLYFEGEDGNSRPVTSMLFAEFLHAIPGLRLVVLNSCYVLLAACRVDERAKELPDKPYSAFTWCLCQELLQAPAEATYRDVIKRTRDAVAAAVKAQTPQVEGARDRRLFGGERSRPAGPADGVETRARYAELSNLAEEDASNPLRGCLEVRFLRRSANGEFRPARPEKSTGEIVYNEGDYLALRVVHHADKPLYIHVLDLGLAGGIGLLHPVDGANEALVAGRALDVGVRNGQRFKLRIPKGFEGREGKESLKILATTLSQ